MNRLILNRNIDVSFKILFKNKEFGLELKICNYSQNDIRLKRIIGKDYSKNIYKTIKPQESCKTLLNQLPSELFPEESIQLIDKKIESIAPERGGLYHPELWKELEDKLPELELIYTCSRSVDVYVPRTHAIVRHAVSKT